MISPSLSRSHFDLPLAIDCWFPRVSLCCGLRQLVWSSVIIGLLSGYLVDYLQYSTSIKYTACKDSTGQIWSNPSGSLAANLLLNVRPVDHYVKFSSASVLFLLSFFFLTAPMCYSFLFQVLEMPPI